VVALMLSHRGADRWDQPLGPHRQGRWDEAVGGRSHGNHGVCGAEAPSMVI